MKILILGGAGYLGYNLTHQLDQIETIEEITIYDNLYRNNLNFFTQGTKFNKVKFLKNDLLNEYELTKACEGKNIVVHLAAYVDSPYSYKDNHKYEQINQFGSAILYNVLKDNPPEKLIYASSGSVYGFQHANEQTEPLPENAYGISKLKGEEYLNLLQQNSVVFTPRIANVFGYNPTFRIDSIINKMIFDALLYNKVHIMGNGNQERPFIHLEHVTQYLTDLIIGKHGVQPITNLVQDTISVNQILEILMSLKPDLEFNYINTNALIKGYKMDSNTFKCNETLTNDIKKTFYQYKSVFTI